MKIKPPGRFIVSTALLTSAQVFAQMAAPAPMRMPMNSPSEQTASNTEGEVRKVDSVTQKVTLKHGDIRNLGMPGMTMAFKVADPKMLDGLKEGDKVEFTADKVNGVLTVTSIKVKN